MATQALPEPFQTIADAGSIIFLIAVVAIVYLLETVVRKYHWLTTGHEATFLVDEESGDGEWYCPICKKHLSF